MTERLTETSIKALKPPSRGARLIWDADITGFTVKIYAPTKAHPAGARTFLLSYWINGSERRMRIGSWPDWSVAAARAEAKDLRQRIDRGEDPASDRREQPLKNLEQHIASKALVFIDQNLEPACYLYRHYHPSGDLLYVGISSDAVDWRRPVQRRFCSGCLFSHPGQINAQATPWRGQTTFSHRDTCGNLQGAVLFLNFPNPTRQCL